LARSFLEATHGQLLYPATGAGNIPGQGVVGFINGKPYRLGNASLHGGLACKLDETDHPAGATVIWLSDEQHLLAAFVLADTARPQAAELLLRLQQQGMKVSILSGDSQQAVAHFAQALGISNWQAGLSPEQKLGELRELQQRGEIVAMVGDGVNDAPVLAGAQVSIAMGSGTQMARATGDVVLLTENLLEIEHAVTTSRFGISVIRQNFAWALAYNLVALPFAATGLISPWMAAIGMSVSSLIVVLNALRLR
jgi:Cu2+-exporting ATPase